MTNSDAINKTLVQINKKIDNLQSELQSLVQIRDLISQNGSLPSVISIELATIMLKEIIDEIANKAFIEKPKFKHRHLKTVDISMRIRVEELVRGRSYFFKMIKTYFPGISLKRMAALIGMSKDQDHSTVIHALKEFDNRYMVEKLFKKEYDLVVERFKLRINEFYTGKNG
jgi:chromosomal replication initiation ATPase DnaA